MKIKQRTKINKPVLAIVIILLVSLVAFLVYTFALKPKDIKTTNTTSANTSSTDKLQSENLQNNPEDKEKAPNSDRPADPVTSSGSSKKQVQMVASTDQSGGTMYIRGGVNYPVTGGGCYAQLSGPSGQSIRKDSSILANPASTDCKTISIATSELASGKWTFTLHYTSDDYEGVSNEISFSV